MKQQLVQLSISSNTPEVDQIHVIITNSPIINQNRDKFTQFLIDGFGFVVFDWI